MDYVLNPWKGGTPIGSSIEDIIDEALAISDRDFPNSWGARLNLGFGVSDPKIIVKPNTDIKQLSYNLTLVKDITSQATKDLYIYIPMYIRIDNEYGGRQLNLISTVLGRLDLDWSLKLPNIFYTNTDTTISAKAIIATTNITKIKALSETLLKEVFTIYTACCEPLKLVEFKKLFPIGFIL